MTYPNLVRTERYGRWMEIPRSAVDDPPARAAFEELAKEGVVEWCREHLLVPVGEPTARCDTEGRLFMERRAIVIGEVRAQGIPPEERQPRRRWWRR